LAGFFGLMGWGFGAPARLPWRYGIAFFREVIVIGRTCAVKLRGRWRGAG
jgi:hypothetical protein